MRIYDERYQRDLRRLQLAWRMIQFGARTPTIERWASLSVYRIRKLRNTYGSEAAARAALKGVTPFRIEFFSKSATLRCEAPMLAGFLRHFDVLPSAEEVHVENLPSLARGERFCTGYEQFRLCCPDSEISFEHAVMLLNELVRGVEIRLARCSSCGDLVVHDCLSARRPSCAYCLHDAHAGLPHFRNRKIEAAETEQNDQEGFQGSLF